MAFKFFIVPAAGSPDMESELNEFLASHRVLSMDRRFVDAGPNSYWAICVDFHVSPSGSPSPSGKKTRIDYKEVLHQQCLNKSAQGRVTR